MSKYYIPKYLDEPYKIAIFTWDEIALLVFSTMISLFLSNGPVMGIGIGSLLVTILKKIKGGEGHNQMMRSIYWHFRPIVRFKSTPASSVREILG